MSNFTRFTQLVSVLPSTIPFIGPEAIERQRGVALKARLGANESGFGPAPSVIQALAEASSTVWQYGDPENFELKQALATHLDTAAANITIGEGIDGLLGLIVRMIVEPGVPVVTSLGAYPTFNYHVKGFGGKLVTVPYRNDHEDLDALLGAVKDTDAPLVYLANPDNPMGSWHSADDIVEFAAALPETTMLVLDEAYCETGPRDAVPQVSKLISMPNVIRTRTFSKVYGLAGLRVGYAFSTPETIATFNKVRNHFGVNRLASVAALAALKDQAYMHEVIGKIRSSLEKIGELARSNGLMPLPSGTNFVAIDCGRDGAYAKSVVEGLLNHGIFIRMPGVAPLDRCIRISAGTTEDLAQLEQALPEVLKSA